MKVQTHFTTSVINQCVFSLTDLKNRKFCNVNPALVILIHFRYQVKYGSTCRFGTSPRSPYHSTSAAFSWRWSMPAPVPCPIPSGDLVADSATMHAVAPSVASSPPDLLFLNFKYFHFLIRAPGAVCYAVLARRRR